MKRKGLEREQTRCGPSLFSDTGVCSLTQVLGLSAEASGPSKGGSRDAFTDQKPQVPQLSTITGDMREMGLYLGRVHQYGTRKAEPLDVF
jgi:hypothetical protein